MRKKLAWYGIVVILVAFAASTLASAQTRSAGVASSERTARATAPSSQGTLTLQRLLQSRLEWTRQLARALRFLEQPPATPGVGTHTIIDEPDPTGSKGELPPDPEEEDVGEEPPNEINDTPGHAEFASS